MPALRRIIVALLTIQAAILDAHFGISHGTIPMAVVFIEGFDHLTAAEITAKGWASSSGWATATGRFAGQSLQTTGSNTVLTKLLPSSYSTLTYGCAVQFNTIGNNNAMLQLLSTGTIVASVFLDSSGHLQVKNSGGTVIATGTTVLLINTWYYVEVKIVVNGASGSCEVHLNGVTEISSTTGNFGSSNINTVGFCRPSSSGSASGTFDDLYACDTSGGANTTFLGDQRVATIYPNGAGSHSAWTPNSGVTNYTQVDEAQADGDTSYVSDSNPGDLDTYAFGDIDAGATVAAIQTNLYARKDDANTRQIAPVIRQGGTDNVGTTVTVTSSYVDYTQIYNTDPSSAAWTPTNVNADEFGVKEIA